MMARVVVQRTQFLMMIERVIQFVRRRHRADQQQHRRQQPGEVSRLSLRCSDHLCYASLCFDG